MAEVDPGKVPNYMAAEYSVGDRMPIESLYYAQFEARKGTDAVAIVKDVSIPPIVDESKGFLSRFAYLDAIIIDGKKLETFDSKIFEYSIDVPLDYDKLPVISAKAKVGYDVEVNMYEDGSGTEVVVKRKGLFPNKYIVNFNVVSKEPISSPWNKSSLENLIDGSEKTSWSQSNNPYVQFYLGEDQVNT